MKPKSIPSRKAEIWTRNGNHINPLNVVSTNMSIKDVCYALSHQPMFGGQTALHYSKAQHACNMYDFLKADLWEYMLRVYKNPDTKPFEFKEKEIIRMCLLYYAGHAYLEPIMGEFNSFKIHNARVTAAVADIIGGDYNTFLSCRGLYDYVDKEVKKEWYGRFYENNDRYGEFWCHMKSRTEYMERIQL